MQCNWTNFLAKELNDAFNPFQAVGSALTQVELVVDGVEVGAQTKCRRCTAVHSKNKKCHSWLSFITARRSQLDVKCIAIEPVVYLGNLTMHSALFPNLFTAMIAFFAGQAWSSGKQWYRQTYHHRSLGDTGQIGLGLSEDLLGIVRAAIRWWTHQADGRSTTGRTTSNSHGEAQERHYVPSCEEEDASRKTKKHKDVCDEEVSTSSTSDVCYVLDGEFSDLLGHHQQHNLHLQRPLPGHAQDALHHDPSHHDRHLGVGRMEKMAKHWTGWYSHWRRNSRRWVHRWLHQSQRRLKWEWTK